MELFKEDITATDPAYENVRGGNHPMEVFARNLCNRLWETFEPLADPHFVNEFSIEFNARFWEMDLTCAFIEKGYEVCCPKPGPDICLNHKGTNVWVEAIAPGNGTGADYVPELTLGIAQAVPDEQLILRLTTALDAKRKQYVKYIDDGIISKEEPYVIAINGCQLNSSRRKIPSENREICFSNWPSICNF